MAAAKKTKPPAVARLVLTIAGVDYRVRPVEPPAGFKRAFRLTRESQAGPVAHVVAVSAAGSTTCDCQAHEYRKDRSDACKHAKAARAVGLL